MNRIITLTLIMFSFSSCQNYDSDEYIKMENEAINDIILEMIEFEKMKTYNGWNDKKRILYIISNLDTNTIRSDRPTGYTIGMNEIKYSKKIVEENKKEFEEDLRKYKLEEKLFSELRKGKIQTRNLNYFFKNENLNIELIEREEFDGLGNLKIKENEFGYLIISRIVFSRDFSTGYLYYGFFCGEACFWSNNVEISKVNGKWRITQYFSGVIT